MAQPTAVEGRTIGRYRVLKHVATGGMAEIYLAHYDDERGVRREAVVKVILRERARDRKFVQMFLDEARVSSTFIHPNIAQLFEVGRDADTYFYAMEYVAGDNVRALIERSLRARMYMPLPVTLAIGTRVAAALHYAHERSSSSGEKLNAVHRDVTPSNIMLGFDGAVKLLDFGIARADSRAQMTQSGTVKGKFAYMSPEQCKGVGVDRRTDVFALGIVLYELSTQRRAFRAESDFETMERILRGDLVPPHRIHADYPRELEAILMRALALDPAERYQTAADFGQALAGFQLARGLPNDDAAVTAIMRQLFVGERARLHSQRERGALVRLGEGAIALGHDHVVDVGRVDATAGALFHERVDDRQRLGLRHRVHAKLAQHQRSDGLAGLRAHARTHVRTQAHLGRRMTEPRKRSRPTCSIVWAATMRLVSPRITHMMAASQACATETVTGLSRGSGSTTTVCRATVERSRACTCARCLSSSARPSMRPRAPPDSAATRARPRATFMVPSGILSLEPMIAMVVQAFIWLRTQMR